MRKRMLWLAISGAVMLVVFPIAPWAQTDTYTMTFTTSCKNCWPGWIELARPAWGVGPSAQNGRGFIFINGFDADALRNRQHLQPARSIERTREVTAFFQFNNATIGGKLPLLTGGFVCLREADVITAVANELFIATIRDVGDAWYGAFIGDLTALDPDFIPDAEMPARQSYSTIGLLQRSESGLELLALKVIPLVRRFVPIALTIALDESDPDAPVLRADVALATGETYRLHHALDPERLLTIGRAGLIYIAGSARPCTTLIQRELALQSFFFR